MTSAPASPSWESQLPRRSPALGGAISFWAKKEFQAPQEGQRPSQPLVSWPHSSQTNIVFSFAIPSPFSHLAN